MKLVDYPRRATVPDLEATLKQRRRSLLVLDHNLGGFAEQLVAIGVVQIVTVAAARLLRLLLPDRLDDVCLARRLLQEEALSFVRRLALLPTQLVPAHQ